MKLRFEIPLLLVVSAGACHGQTVCFGSVGEALAGRGTSAANGFRLEAFVEDPLNGKRWAKVERCAHPEWPALLVADAEPKFAAVTKVRVPAADRAVAAAHQPSDVASGLTSAPMDLPVVRAGETVTVVERTPLLQLEVGGVALNSARAGDAVKVRVGNADAGAPPQVVLGTARGRGLVELASGIAEHR